MSTNKYDRQTRLWGEGQYLISTGSLLVLGVNTLSLEITKNLVLSGIGHITLIDDRLITNQDIKENFYIRKSEISKPIVCSALSSVLELNPDTKGEGLEINIRKLINSDEKNEKNQIDFGNYSIILSCNNDNDFNHRLNIIAEQYNSRLVIASNSGLLGYLRLYEKHHAGLQLKLPDKQVVDLRIPCMWDELKTHCEEYDFHSQTDVEHSNTPYVIILQKSLEEYKKKYMSIPKKPEEKENFKRIIKSFVRTNDIEEENYKEALNFYYYACEGYTNQITNVLSELFEKIHDESRFKRLLNQSNPIMKACFIVIKSLKLYYETYKSLPLVGSLPDMTSETMFFIRLKKIYEDKSKKDRKDLMVIVKKVLEEYNQLLNDSLKYIYGNDFNVFDLICKNWSQLNYHEFSLFETSLPDLSSIDAYDEKDKTNLIWYILFKSSEIYYVKYGKYPGKYLFDKDFHEEKDEFLNEYDSFKAVISHYLENSQFKERNVFCRTVEEIPDYMIKEFLRNSRLTVIPLVSIIGAISSQEIIKLLTYSFETINNTIIFNGIDVSSSVFNMS